MAKTSKTLPNLIGTTKGTVLRGPIGAGVSFDVHHRALGAAARVHTSRLDHREGLRGFVVNEHPAAVEVVRRIDIEPYRIRRVYDDRVLGVWMSWIRDGRTFVIRAAWSLSRDLRVLENRHPSASTRLALARRYRLFIGRWAAGRSFA
ncbi:MAG: hypothetical protein DRJ42_03525 [Deltaproteobacteria bacterium]|nr:MAG: hypothetical protein DRJ42_03525 [Deltaproteobacteria bacterium]